MITQTPTLHAFVSGSSEGFTPLNAFDGALLDAGVGNTNLVKMSSIVPPATREVDVADMRLPPGALVRPKAPQEYFRKLRFHQHVTSVDDYGIKARELA